jgi:hypothetical protein
MSRPWGSRHSIKGMPKASCWGNGTIEKRFGSLNTLTRERVNAWPAERLDEWNDALFDGQSFEDCSPMVVVTQGDS